MNKPVTDLRLCCRRGRSIQGPRWFSRALFPGKRKDFPFEVVLPTHLAVHGVVLCEHMRSMDWRARRVTFVGRAPDEILLEVREVVATIAGVDLE